jgi:hypothetical protein
MKIIKIFLVFVLSVILFSSCVSSKTLQREIQTFRTDLYYELTSNKYLGETDKTVYLNFIDNSNIDYYSSVKKKGTLIIPLLFVNYSRERFEFILGERTLTQLYREFLTEALLAECNRSACFNLKSNTDNIAPDSAYILDVKIVHNHTTSGIVSNNTSLLLFSDELIDFPSNTVKQAVSDLQIAVRLAQGENSLYEKTYTAQQKLNFRGGKTEDPLFASEDCLINMTECLSITTKNIVEDISRSIHLIMLTR